jgi:hypothetical protein
MQARLSTPVAITSRSRRSSSTPVCVRPSVSASPGPGVHQFSPCQAPVPSYFLPRRSTGMISPPWLKITTKRWAREIDG